MNKKLFILAAMAFMLVGCNEEVTNEIEPKEKVIETVVIKPEPPKEVVVKDQPNEVVVKEVKTPVTPGEPDEKVPLSNGDLKALHTAARAAQWKVFDGEAYTVNQVKEIFSPHFTDYFINRFVVERMTPFEVNGETKYHVPGSDDGHLILWDGAISFTDETDVRYYEESSIEFMNISEHQQNELDGNHLLTIVFKNVDGKYKINDITREWE